MYLMYIRPEADAVELGLDSKYLWLMFIRPEADAVEVGMDSNDKHYRTL